MDALATASATAKARVIYMSNPIPTVSAMASATAKASVLAIRF